MASEDAKQVARDVLESVGNGQKTVLRKIIKKNGYAQNTADSPKQVTETKSYKEVINPVVNKWIRERDRLTKELESRDLTGERYETVIKSIDIITKNIQLLSGKETERIISDGFTQEERDNLLALTKNDNKTSP
jgi:hypothetical protein